MEERCEVSHGGLIDRYFTRRSIALDLLFCLLLTGLSLGFASFWYDVQDQAIYLPLQAALEQPQLFQTDYIRPVFTTFPTLFFRILACLHLPEDAKPAVFFIGTIVFRFFCFLGIIKIADALFRRWGVSYASALVFAAGALFWYNNLYDFAPDNFAKPFLFLAIYLFIRKRIEISFLIIGVMINIHGISAVTLAALLSVAAIFNYRVFRWKRISLGFALCIIAAVPMLLLHLYSKPSVCDFATWLHVLKIRSYFEISPKYWLLQSQIILFLLLTISALCLSTVSSRLKTRTGRNTWRAVLLGVVCLLAISFFGSEVVPLRIIIELRLWRSMWFLPIFAVPAIMIHLIDMLNTGSASRRLAGAVMLLCFVSGSNVLGLFGLALLVLILLSTYIPRAGGVRRLLYICPPLIVGILCLAFKFWSYPPSQELPSARRLIESAHILLATLLVLLVLVLILRKRLAFSTATLVTLTICFVAVSVHSIIHNGVYRGQHTAWVDVQHWAKKNTSVDTIFLTPPHIEGFRVFSQRATAFEWKDGTLNIFDPQFGKEWWRRAKMFGLDNAPLAYPGEGESKEREQIFRDIDEGSLVNIAHNLDATYIILEKPRYLSLVKEYENERFIVYRTPPVREEPSR